MAIYLQKHKLTYFSVPKVACSSLKRFFFEIENGFPFQVFKLNGKRYGIHNFASSVEFSEVKQKKIADHAKIAVVRDPWRRILSCYASKVASQKVLRDTEFTPEQKRAGLVRDPSLENFVDLLEEYQKANWNIRHHSRPLSYFLGKDPTYFDRIFSMSGLPEMVEYVAGTVGKVPELPHVNSKTASSTQLNEDEAAIFRPKIEKVYAEDIELYGRYMS